MSRYVVAVVVERGDADDHPADWDWSTLLACRAEHVLSAAVPDDGRHVRTAIDDDAVWLYAENGEVTW